MKIGIIEDNVWDVVDRYSYLKGSQHEVQIGLDSQRLLETLTTKEQCNYILEKEGFDLRNIYYYDYCKSRLNEIPFADIYFCDGLKGRCFKIADELGKNKVYIHSDDCSLTKKAKEKGYLLGGWKDSLEEIIKERTQ